MSINRNYLKEFVKELHNKNASHILGKDENSNTTYKLSELAEALKDLNTGEVKEIVVAGYDEYNELFYLTDWITFEDIKI